MASEFVNVSEQGLGRRYALGERCLIGRLADCEIQLVDSQVSKQHARVTATDGRYTIEDLGSLNGVMINGRRIDVPVVLASNDVVTIGRSIFLFDPDLEILPVDNGRAVLLTSDLTTRPARMMALDDKEGPPPDRVLQDQLLRLMADEARPERLLEGLVDIIRASLPFDAAAILVAGQDGLESLTMVCRLQTVSIPSSIVALALDQQQALCIPDACGDTVLRQGHSVINQQVRSVLVVPLVLGKRAMGLLYLHKTEPDCYGDRELALLAGCAPLMAALVVQVRRVQALNTALGRQNALLPVAPALVGGGQFVGAVRDFVAKVASVSSSVLLAGDTGTGKEVVAQQLHVQGPGPRAPWVALNCGAIPEHLVESAFFGHEAGAFTGADKARPGSLELASGGTLFLDEVGELPLAVQVKLLRALQERTFYRLGGVRPIQADFRLISATNRDLERGIRDGTFREDLYFRLNVVAFHLPPLRERPDDIEPLVRHFLALLGPELGRRVEGLEAEAMELLEAYHWPGNVRELRNVIERALVISQGPVVGVEQLPADIIQATRMTRGLDLGGGSMADQVSTLERQLVEAALKRSRGVKVAACKLLAISRPTLDKKLRDFGIDVEQFEES